MLVGWLALIALAIWAGILLLPSRPWSTRERLDVPAGLAAEPKPDLSRVTVLIPARNEAPAIGATLEALAAQGRNLRVIVIDDESEDETARVATVAGAACGSSLALCVLAGQSLPESWGGKLWALEQGLAQVESDFCLLLDAEIILAPGMLCALLNKAESEARAMVSIMAKLRCQAFWERLLVPPFIFFFKLLYPFARANNPDSRTAAAAGGCVLIRTRVLRGIGGFAAIRDALIDDCTLAGRVKRAGHSIWLGLSESVVSARAYADLASFRRMVTRTAFTQLSYSGVLLALVCLLLLIMFAAPWVAIAAGTGLLSRGTGGLALLAMAAAYWPTIRFYGLPAVWTLTLPFAAVLFLAMTIESALNYWRGIKARWKGRNYASD